MFSRQVIEHACLQDAGERPVSKLACHDAAARPADLPDLQDGQKGLDPPQTRGHISGAAT